MKRWQWTIQQIISALDITGLAGLAMLIAGGALYFGIVRPDAQEVVKNQQTLTLIKRLPKQERQSTPADDLAMFYNFFPARDALAEQLRTVHRLAKDRKLSIEHVDYKLSKIQGTPLVKYQISFPLNTDYPNLRRYLTKVLQTLPNAALQDIELQRADADTETLDETISLTLFFRESP